MSLLRGKRLRGFAGLCLGLLLGGLVCQSAKDTGQLFFKSVLPDANANGLFGRECVSAYIGALRMVTDRPWSGFGWCEPDVIYPEYYMDSQLVESQAILLNSYLMLGMTLGLPAVFAFVVYLSLSFISCPSTNNEKLSSRTTKDAADRLPRAETLICRAGAVVLLVGFWLDGGLFLLPIGALFWTLLETANSSLPLPVN